MRFLPIGLSRWRVGTKLTSFTFALVSLILAGVVLSMSWSGSSMLQQRSIEAVGAELNSLISAVELFNKAMSSQAANCGRMFAEGFAGELALDTAHTVDVGGRDAPVMTLNGKPLNLDYTLPDQFARLTGGNATVFAAQGDDFVRVTTSVRKENGDRAIGTLLDRNGKAYAALRAGTGWIGLVRLFGKDFITDYEPVRGKDGRVIGALYVGIDVSKEMAALRDRIRTMKVGETGYFFVLDARPGEHLGELLVHPLKEGKNILGSRDAAGREFIKEMLEQKQGVVTYPWQNVEKGETSPRDKVAVYATFKEWNWLIAGGTYVDETVRAAAHLRNRYILVGLGALAVFAFALHALIRRTVTRPLAEARDAAMRIADGDLGARMANDRRDELGLLAEAMNGISGELSAVVGQVRQGAEQIAGASGEISTGNLDLCARTEQQATSLAATAGAMRDLTATVRRNADDAHEANQLAVNTAMVAQEGGRMVTQVIDTMDAIRQSSGRIGDIIGVIDGIAFQTNILALNAAVEAARAGEQGRGFAVVAAEVRSLAQRSAAAAKEIKTLIDASGAEVDAGSRVVREAGVTMNEVLESAGHVKAIMARISGASTAQSAGIEHVNRTIDDMDRATQQNAALVQQASAAAQAMQEQAAALARAVRQFKLDESDEGQARPLLTGPRDHAFG
jgi:methyl-accepting chemotaxis protein-2 (aspartate sensor receptor)